MSRICLALVILLSPLLVGCNGCRREVPPESSTQEEEDETAVQDFVAGPAQAYPGDQTLLGAAIKPRHWTTASVALQCNKLDARGELSSRCQWQGVSLRSGTPTQTTGAIPNLRPVVMPKGQRRNFDYRILPPLPISSEQSTCFLSSQFSAPSQSLFFDSGAQPFRMMRPQEYFLVILTNRGERFTKLRQSDWAKRFFDPNQIEFYPQQGTRNHYRIVVPNTDGVLPIADTMLDWTSTAVVLWDDLSGDALTPDQLVAMNDWLHFGGRLIVNGASAADQIVKTSLADNLALKPTSNIELDSSAAVELLRGWKVASDRSVDKQVALVQSQSGRVATDGVAAADAVALPRSGNLVLTRRVGRGHVVQPRFDLTSDWLTDWDSSQSFFNSAILGRPARVYVKTSSVDAIVQQYTDGTSGGPRSGRIRPARGLSPSQEAAINTNVRLFSRDASLSGDRYFRVDPVSGLSGWKDDSDVVRRCSEVLRSQSGIEIPQSRWVLKSLGIYLVVLVPLNYLIFRIVGRLEYAWMAVPLIAIGGAVWVARAAQLDIGFARSQNEVALLELHSGHPRGHLTRILAVYNSLSSSYDMRCQSIDGCAAPMDLYAGSKPGRGFGETTFRTSFDEGPTLSDVSIDSNQVRLMHVEQIVDVGGGFEWTVALPKTQPLPNGTPDANLDRSGASESERSLDDRDAANYSLINRSSLQLQDALIVKKNVRGEVQIAILGQCASGSKNTPRFRSVDRVSTASDLSTEMQSFLARITDPQTVAPGSTRLVGRVDAAIDGFRIEPRASQNQSHTFVMVHLSHPPSAEPEIDVNLLSDVRDPSPTNNQDAAAP